MHAMAISILPTDSECAPAHVLAALQPMWLARYACARCAAVRRTKLNLTTSMSP